MFSATCPCGRVIQIPPDALGRRVRCTTCGASVLVREDPGTGETVASFESAPEPSRAARPVREAEPLLSHETDDPVWNRRYWFLAAALIPLFFSFFHHRETDLRKKLEKTLQKAAPAVQEKAKEVLESDHATLDDLLAVLPGDRLDGALLPRKTHVHWAFALVSAAGFLGTILVLFPRGRETAKHLLVAGAFTGTLGILLLLAVQWIAFSTQGVWLRGGGRAALILLVLKFIGFSYRAALDPENGVIASFFGFTCGVGLCEELSKQLPVIAHYWNGGSMSWRSAALWGMASGIGFGVSEGITYSSDFYNGSEGGQIYAVRFVSCVALHAFWAAAAAIALSKDGTTLSRADHQTIAFPILKAIAIPMALHGAYDTLLKKDLGIAAFVMAVASFAWLAFQIERSRKEDAGAPSHPSPRAYLGFSSG